MNTIPRDYNSPSPLALDLRKAIKNVFKNYAEYRAAFASMSGRLSGDDVYDDTTTDLAGFQPFAEDVLQRVIASSKIANLYDEVAKGEEKLSFAALVVFAEGVTPKELLDMQEAASAKQTNMLKEEEGRAREMLAKSMRQKCGSEKNSKGSKKPK